MNRIHLKILFERENRNPGVATNCSGDKAYLSVRCEDKQLVDALGTGCSRKGILR